MTLLSLAIVIIVVGVLLWAVQEFIPMDAKVLQLLRVVVLIGLVLFILQSFGLITNLTNLKLK